MARSAPDVDPRDADGPGGGPAAWAAGVPGVAHALGQSWAQMGVRRSVATLRLLNQADGFDCPGCAWPDPNPGKRSHTEFCENGAKAVAEEATLRRVSREFFATHSLTDLAGRSGYWLGQQGRLTEPMLKRPGSDHYEPVSWDDAATTGTTSSTRSARCETGGPGSSSASAATSCPPPRTAPSPRRRSGPAG